MISQRHHSGVKTTTPNKIKLKLVSYFAYIIDIERIKSKSTDR